MSQAQIPEAPLYERPDHPYGLLAHRETRADDPRGFSITMPPGYRNSALEEFAREMETMTHQPRGSQ